MCKDLAEFKTILEQHAVRGRPFQVTPALYAKISHQLAPFVDCDIKDLLVDIVDFFNEEYGCATASALDGDPLVRSALVWKGS